MSRRNRPEKRQVPPDARYNSVDVQSFINRIMKNGKKSLAARLVYDAFELIGERTKKNPLEVFEQAMSNASPSMEVKPRRVGGATYQVPMEVPSHRQFALATRWLIAATRASSGKNFTEKLASELMDAANKTGAAVHKREEVHKMAKANRAFSHYQMR
ncbi:MAG: 30S ribosomal protein S7 [Chloroflexi bacterium]|nr:30S ribosomal protein S7 [Chloroflexota bacterium]